MTLARRLRRPSWRDRRLVLGAVLVLTSALLGARLLGEDAPAVNVWAARHDLAPGVELRGEDLVAVPVVLGDRAGAYSSADAAVPTGTVLTRPLSAGELLPVAAVSNAGPDVRTRVVTIPVDRFHVPADLARGERIDVHVSPERGEAAGRSRLLASGAVVVDVEGDGGRFGGSSSGRGVSVAVSEASVAVLVGGMGAGVVDLVRVPAGVQR